MNPVYVDDAGTTCEVDGVRGHWFIASYSANREQHVVVGGKFYTRKRDAVDALINYATLFDMRKVKP